MERLHGNRPEIETLLVEIGNRAVAWAMIQEQDGPFRPVELLSEVGHHGQE